MATSTFRGTIVSKRSEMLASIFVLVNDDKTHIVFIESMQFEIFSEPFPSATSSAEKIKHCVVLKAFGEFIEIFIHILNFHKIISYDWLTRLI